MASVDGDAQTGLQSRMPRVSKRAVAEAQRRLSSRCLIGDRVTFQRCVSWLAAGDGRQSMQRHAMGLGRIYSIFRCLRVDELVAEQPQGVTSSCWEFSARSFNADASFVDLKFVRTLTSKRDNGCIVCCWNDVCVERVRSECAFQIFSVVHTQNS